MRGNRSRSEGRLTDTIHYSAEQDWDFVMSMKKNKKERNPGEVLYIFTILNALGKNTQQ